MLFRASSSDRAEADEAYRVHPDLHRELRLRVAVVAEADPLDADGSPVPVHLPVEHAAVLELRAEARLGHPPRQLQVASPRPFGVVGEPGLRRQPPRHDQRPHGGLAGEVGVGPDTVGSERVIDVAPNLGIGLGAGAGGEQPALGIGRLAQLLTEPADQCGAPLSRGIGARQHSQRIRPPERTQHRRGVGDVAAGDEMLEQGKPRIVEGEVGRRLRRANARA